MQNENKKYKSLVAFASLMLYKQKEHEQSVEKILKWLISPSKYFYGLSPLEYADQGVFFYLDLIKLMQQYRRGELIW